MRKIILIPDSFKGTMSSAEICEIMGERIRFWYPEAEVIQIPVADGGEGSVDAFLTAMQGEKVYLSVKGPFMEDMQAFYGLIEAGQTAVIEMAACAGLPLVGDTPNPLKATTYGVGQLMAAAARRGCKKIILGLGGSATNDFGAGAAAALGIKFINAAGESFIPTGGTLAEITKIDKSGLLPELKAMEIVTMCDINNPLYGKTGAAYVFGPQKGADANMVVYLDEQLRAVDKTVQAELGIDVSQLAGAGAAGGMGGGMVAFFGSQLRMGIEVVLDTVNFSEHLKGADLVISGEGRIDSQSLGGKVVIGVARRAKAQQVPVVAIVGAIGDDIDAAYDEGVSAIFSINRAAIDFSIAKLHSKGNLRLTMDNLLRLINCFTLDI